MRPRRSVSFAAVIASTLTLTVVAASCGVGAESSPQALERDAVPFDLLEPGVTTSTTTTPTETPLVRIQVYLMGAERLQPVVREITGPATARKAINALFSSDVSPEELAAGLRNAINPDVQLLSVAVEDGVATIDMSESFLAVSTPEQRLALAQFVFTATAIPGVTGVRITLEGELREVPTDQGASSGPLRREAFAQLAPVPPAG